MKIPKRKNKIYTIDNAQQSFKRKGRVINLMVFSILSFIALLLISEIS